MSPASKVKWPAPSPPFPPVHHLFSLRASETPHAVALCYGPTPTPTDNKKEGQAHPSCPSSLTYAELEHKADKLADTLRKCGVCRDGLVAIHMERSMGVVVAMLGVLKAGGAYVPIDPTHPKDRQDYIISSSRASVVITDANDSYSSTSYHSHSTSSSSSDVATVTDEQSDTSSDTPTPIIVIPLHTHGDVADDFQEPVCAPDRVDVDVCLSSDKDNGNGSDSDATTTDSTSSSIDGHESSSPLCYVLFTSGSTGKPKGVCIQHDALSNVVQWFVRELCLCSSDRMLALTTFTFDISMLEVFMPLVSGGTLQIAPSALQKDAHALADALTSERPTVFQATPATFEMLMAVGWGGDPDIQVLCGGEAFRMNLAPLTTRCKSFRNVYGPTETTIWSSSFRVSSTPTGPLPLGDPISHTQLYVLDKDLKPCTQGAEGELFIGGVGLARGYHQRPDLTSKAFIPNPFKGTSGGTGDRIYATGDIVVREADGSLRYVGRRDSQVKIQGYRIELGEIEKALQLHPSLQTAVVVARDDVTATGTKVLVAYLRPKHTHAQAHAHSGDKDASSSSVRTVAEKDVDPSLTDAAVCAYLSQSLPPYMIPRFFVRMLDFPYTPNGKVDRKQLPPPTLPSRRRASTPKAADAPVPVPDNSNSNSNNNHHTANDDSQRGGNEEVEDVDVEDVDGEEVLLVKVMDVIEQASGMELEPWSTLQSLAIDSMGTVVMLEQLSRALGGLRIRPAEFLGHDTLQDLVTHLHRRVVVEKPELLRSNGKRNGKGDRARAASENKDTHATTSEDLDPVDGDVDVVKDKHHGARTHTHAHDNTHAAHTQAQAQAQADGAVAQDQDNKDQDPGWVSKLVAPHQRLLAGLRGICIFWVLMEHSMTADAVDRAGGRFAFNTCLIAILCGMSLYFWWAAAMGRVSWKSYLFNKAVGLFPVYYVSLVLSLPRYIGLRRRVMDLAIRNRGRLPRAYRRYYYDNWGPYIVDWGLFLTAQQIRDVRVNHRVIPLLYYVSVQWNQYLYFGIAMVAFSLVYPRLPANIQGWLSARAGVFWASLLVVTLAIPLPMLILWGICAECNAFHVQCAMGVAIAGLYLHHARHRDNNNTNTHTHSHGHSHGHKNGCRCLHSVARELRPLVLVIAIAVLGGNAHITMDEYTDDIMYYVVLPIVTVALLLVLLWEREGDHSWIRSKVIESELCRTLGDLALGIYVFHTEVFNYWMRMAVEGWDGIMPPDDMPIDSFRFEWRRSPWIRRQGVLLKAVSIVMVISLAWAVQHVLLDGLVTPLLLRVATYAHKAVDAMARWWLQSSEVRKRRLSGPRKQHHQHQRRPTSITSGPGPKLVR